MTDEDLTKVSTRHLARLQHVADVVAELTARREQPGDDLKALQRSISEELQGRIIAIVDEDDEIHSMMMHVVVSIRTSAVVSHVRRPDP
jgi:hypothetical protein